MAVMAVDAGAPVAVKERLEAFAGEVLAAAMNRPVQLVNGGLYLRGLLEEGARKSLEPIVERLGGDAQYQSMQQFLADSPWDPALVVRAVAERVAPEIDVEAWVLDDTGFPKDGKDSPGVKRQYSGTLGKTGNCQIGVSVHAVGGRGGGRGARGRAAARAGAGGLSRTHALAVGLRFRHEGQDRQAAEGADDDVQDDVQGSRQELEGTDDDRGGRAGRIQGQQGRHVGRRRGTARDGGQRQDVRLDRA